MTAPPSTPRRDLITPALALVGVAVCAWSVGALVGAPYGWASLAFALSLAVASIAGAPHHRCHRCTRLPYGVIRWWGRYGTFPVLLAVHALVPVLFAALVVSGVPWGEASGAVIMNALGQLSALWAGSVFHVTHCAGGRR